MKTDISTSDVATTAPVISFIARLVASKPLTLSSTMWRTMFSSTTIASSTTSPVASVSPNSVSVLIVEAHHLHRRERADQRDRNRDRRDQRAVPVLQEDEDDEHDQQDRDQQRDDDFLDRRPHEVRRIEGDRIVHAGSGRYGLRRSIVARTVLEIWSELAVGSPSIASTTDVRPL